MQLMQLAKTAQHYSVTACNQELTPRQEKRATAADHNAQQLATALGLQCHIGGDPRGYVYHLILPDGSYNTWGGPTHGWGIPT